MAANTDADYGRRPPGKSEKVLTLKQSMILLIRNTQMQGRC